MKREASLVNGCVSEAIRSLSLAQSRRGDGGRCIRQDPARRVVRLERANPLQIGSGRLGGIFSAEVSPRDWIGTRQEVVARGWSTATKGPMRLWRCRFGDGVGTPVGSCYGAEPRPPVAFGTVTLALASTVRVKERENMTEHAKLDPSSPISVWLE